MSVTHIPAELRRHVRERATLRCEYCLIPESAAFASHEIDHIVAEKHGGATVSENLSLSCALCNGYKGSDVASVDAESGETVRLFHPRRDVWSNHFISGPDTIEPVTPIGRVTVQLLRMNSAERVEERQLLGRQAGPIQ